MEAAVSPHAGPRRLPTVVDESRRPNGGVKREVHRARGYGD